MKKSAKDPAIDEFVAEGREILDRVNRALQALEGDAKGVDIIGGLYRDMHTLKGSAQLFGFELMGLIAHSMEASLDPLRKVGAAVIKPRLLEACLKSVDLLEKLLKSIANDATESSVTEKKASEAIGRLVDAAASQFSGEIVLTKDHVFPEENLKKTKSFIENKSSKNNAKNRDGESMAKSESQAKKAEPVKPVFTSSTAALAASANSIEGGGTIGSPSEASQSAGGAGSAGGSSGSGVLNSGVESTIRVQVSLLDRILNLVGELVLVRNQLIQYRNKNDDLEFMNTSKTLDMVTSELQSEVMKTRMQPIDTVVSKFQRLVRDVAKELNKKIDLTIEGKETELDKTLLEAVKDPLTHIVRNSCDHGIESVENRLKANKPETGHLLIRSFHEGGQVVIEISDDGRGLNKSAIIEKAIAKGLVPLDQISKLQNREIYEMIFHPGFSTASQVTAVSGRGVGMDVVKTNIEKIGGTVELSSVEGKGTTIQLRIPLTLAIVPALLVRSEGEKFAIPQIKLVELVRVSHEDNGVQIEYLQQKPMYRLRGSLLPLLDLRVITGGKPKNKYSEGTYIVVLNSESGYFGLIVEEILDTADIVVKPLSAFLKNLNSFSGATILGDGSIALILDVDGIAQETKVVSKRNKSEDPNNFHGVVSSKAKNSEVQEFLLFSLFDKSVHAVPLCLVHRLEELNRADIEKSGRQKIFRYRDALMPILDLEEILVYESLAETPKTNNPTADFDFKQKDEAERVSVVVVQRSGRNYGLEVSEILDVVSIDSLIDDTITDRAGILGNIVYNNRVVIVVDALGIIENFSHHLNSPGQASKGSGSKLESLTEIRNENLNYKRKKVRVLYAEDVAFFRKQVSKVLLGAGIEVTAVEDGRLALEELQRAEVGTYNMVLSDIEMPRMTGLELAREIRKIDKFKSLPLIALTTRFRQKDIDEGHLAGFTDYLEKLNPEKLLKCINLIMGDENSSRHHKQEIKIG